MMPHSDEIPERTVVVHWEGPYPWESCREVLAPEHVLYTLHGSHHLYGMDVLLYLGRSDKGIEYRLKSHERWVAEEYDKMTVRFASVGDFVSWADWERVERYPSPDSRLLAAVEALLIFAHQPAYNVTSKAAADPASKGLRIMNTDKQGHLLPEVSYLYHSG
jgi:hypothetical protein